MKTFDRRPAHTHLIVELLDRLRQHKSNIAARRAERLLLHWWRRPPVRCSVCYEGRWLRKWGACEGCGVIYFERKRHG